MPPVVKTAPNSGHAARIAATRTLFPSPTIHKMILIFWLLMLVAKGVIAAEFETMSIPPVVIITVIWLGLTVLNFGALKSQSRALRWVTFVCNVIIAGLWGLVATMTLPERGYDPEEWGRAADIAAFLPAAVFLLSSLCVLPSVRTHQFSTDSPVLPFALAVILVSVAISFFSIAYKPAVESFTTWDESQPSAQVPFRYHRSRHDAVTDFRGTFRDAVDLASAGLICGTVAIGSLISRRRDPVL